MHKLDKVRASFYKQRRQTFISKHFKEPILIDLVLEQRKKMPRLGGRKLHYLIAPSLKQSNLYVGRDRFFAWLKQQDLLVKPKKSYTKTTNSFHRFYKHGNLIKDLIPTEADQIWVSDITYIRKQKGFCYLALITDAYSRKIIGYDLSDSLDLTGCLNALKMAAKHRIRMNTIHHSDRGIQYCSNQYVQLAEKHGIKVSMGEAGNCYDNALAERVNGILKNEFNLDATYKNLKTAQKAVSQAIKTYNESRPHLALKMKKPVDLYAA
ncbi:IS3 family transposase [Aquirufa nivalisilvae]|uniref:IS3 family transposase n=1 Tax=Aquirufa nivalisilvae TaxID=2516557 RepID=UPI00268FD5B4|nr:IS3 family transposase [Aquirufa nivalisilvae]